MPRNKNKEPRKRRPTLYKLTKTPPHAQLVATNRILHKSKVRNPVQFAWETFERAKVELGDKFRRKTAIDYAIARGLAFYTARTQYQEWKKAGDRDRIQAAANLAKYGSVATAKEAPKHGH